MRRLLAVVAVAAALLSASACSDGKKTGDQAGAGSPGASAGSGGSPGAAGSPGATGGAVGNPPGDQAANTKAVCEAAQKAAVEGMTTLLTELNKMIEANSRNDAAAADKARKAAEAALRNIVTTLRSEAAKATKPELRTVLENAAKDFEKLTPDLKNLNEQTFTNANDEIAKICG
jgi:hypothetical protein